MHVYVFFEASHGKSKSDGLGGVVKGYASREVTSKNVLMRNTKRIVWILQRKTRGDKFRGG